MTKNWPQRIHRPASKILLSLFLIASGIGLSIATPPYRPLNHIYQMVNGVIGWFDCYSNGSNNVMPSLAFPVPPADSLQSSVNKPISNKQIEILAADKKDPSLFKKDITLASLAERWNPKLWQPRDQDLEQKNFWRTKELERSKLELQLMSYRKQVQEHMDTAIKIAIKHQDRSCRWLYTDAPPRFFLEINKNGSIKELAIVASSGSALLDELLLKALRSAEMFPPIPEHLGLQTFTLGME